jgi:cysteine-rich repeat protein
MHLLLPYLASLLYLIISPTDAVSEFWTKAQQTLVLSQTRNDRNPQALTPPIRDPILDNPAFLPLCGNGRVDTKADYTIYYLSHPPLNLTKQQILYQRYDVQNPNMLHNITILADEECDDGNRFDLDGCSADCMHVDAWTSACEIAVDVDNKTLIYEDLIFDTVRNVMVVSASDGIYSLNLAVGDFAMKARLIASKSFPITSISRRLNSLILYSSVDQTLWQLLDGESSISLQRNLSHERRLTEWNDKGHFNTDGSIIIHDSTMMLFFASPSSVPITCNNSEGYVMRKCVFLQITNEGDNAFQCSSFEGTIRVIIGPKSCALFPPYSTPSDSKSLLYDVVTMTTQQAAMFNLVPYSINVTITPPQALDSIFLYAQYYTPWGILIECPISSARKMGSAGMASSPNQMHFIGDASLVSMVTLQTDGNCGPAHCGLDTKLQYDILDPNPLRNTGVMSWGDVLQDKIIREAGNAPMLTTIAAIKDTPARYSNVLNAFFASFMQITAPLTVLAFQIHPVTHNLWALRRDKLVEISKSGVQLQRLDGKCIPSGIALCPACQWAPSGSTCRPCAQADANSWAWTAKCKDKVCAGRRLLAVGVTNIRFTITGNATTITLNWPDAVKSGSVYNIVVATTDPIAEMRRIREKLELIVIDVQVVTQPYEIILVNETTISTPEPIKADNIIVIISIAVPVLIIIISVIIVISLNRANHPTPAQALHGQCFVYMPYRRVYTHQI